MIRVTVWLLQFAYLSESLFARQVIIKGGEEPASLELFSLLLLESFQISNDFRRMLFRLHLFVNFPDCPVRPDQE